MQKYRQPGPRAFIFFLFFIFHFALLLSSCSLQKKISKSANRKVLSAPSLQTAHVGISIFEPATNKYWYNYQGDHYFVPASNTKIPTCYAAMKYLGDSLICFTYDELPDAIYIRPNGDPTFLLPEFKSQPALDFLKKLNKPVAVDLTGWQTEPLGSGWSWNDYQEDYMAERSAMPIYGNLVRFSGKQFSPDIMPRKAVEELVLDSAGHDSYLKDVSRSRMGNRFTVTASGARPAIFTITFDTKNGKFIEQLLSDTLKLPVNSIYPTALTNYRNLPDRMVKTQPTDSLLRPMMHRSDNFFAEQSLLMVSNNRLGVMDDRKIIDTLLKTDFKDLPQRPRWVDGSGLSRYNLFTPQDLVSILAKMKNDFGLQRMKTIFATGGEGTIRSYFNAGKGAVYAKTGTLSGVVSLSGFMYTKKNKFLLFSVLVNNHQASATDIRRAVEKFIEGIRSRF